MDTLHKTVFAIVLVLFVSALLLLFSPEEKIEQQVLPPIQENIHVEVEPQPLQEEIIPEEIPPTSKQEPGIETIPESTTHQVEISRFTLSPSNLSIKQNDIVIWINNDTRLHQLGGRGKDFFRKDGKRVIERLFQNDTFNWTFSEKGVYPYLDVIFGSRGEITVT